MSVTKKAMSRRDFLRGSGGIAVGLPFLNAMIPSLANAQSVMPLRSVFAFAGTCQASQGTVTPSAVGALKSLTGPWSPLSSVMSNVSIISGLTIPQYQGTGTPPPGGAYNMQHYTTPHVLFTGYHSKEIQPYLVNEHSVDQHIADSIGNSTRIKSVQARVQAMPYNGTTNQRAGQLSSRNVNGKIQALAPIASPLALFNQLFSVGVPTGPSTQPSLLVRKKKSVLDLVLDDANRLMANVDSDDKARLEQHFTEIRSLEKSLAASTTIPSGGGCQAPQTPGADPAPNGTAFGSWANETLRGDQMAEILALAIACDVSRVYSWMLSFDQCFLDSQLISGRQTDMHDITHTGTDAEKAANMKWHVERWAKLVERLSKLKEGSGTVLDNTFLSLVFAEGVSAHNRSYLTYAVAGRPTVIKNGEHIKGNGEHPVKMMIAGMNSVGVMKNSLGEISGPLASLMK